ncbi:hypothetical protein HPP92_017975 [Vanilla planifolia]|uniref:Uncharacterized protein n=1 Tax=Vanilla planifolia TaxID=51239 RepID=A0A835QGJ1_VANPL|nr:hypothetical protein HPP92_017975 [Vanilla planifolia]
MQRKFTKRKKSKGLLKALTGTLYPTPTCLPEFHSIVEEVMTEGFGHGMQRMFMKWKKRKVNDVGIPRRNGGRTNSHAKSNDKEINAKEKGAFVQQQKLLVTAEPLGLLKRWSMF